MHAIIDLQKLDHKNDITIFAGMQKLDSEVSNFCCFDKAFSLAKHYRNTVFPLVCYTTLIYKILSSLEY